MLKGSDKTILIEIFCVGQKKLVEISINCHDTGVNITVQYFEVACIFSSIILQYCRQWTSSQTFSNVFNCNSRMIYYEGIVDPYTIVLKFYRSLGKNGKIILKREYQKGNKVWRRMIPLGYPLQSSYAYNFLHAIFSAYTYE